MPRSPSADKSAANPLLYVFMHTIVAAVRSDTTDLTARQLAVFLKAYLEPQTEHTVRGFFAELNVSKPAVTRALDRLAKSDFIKREQDKHDRRSIIVRRTSAWIDIPSNAQWLRERCEEASGEAGCCLTARCN